MRRRSWLLCVVLMLWVLALGPPADAAICSGTVNFKTPDESVFASFGTIIFPNGSLTNNGDGTVSVVISGTGTVTQVNTAAPLNGGPITGLGTIGIADAAADGVTKGAATFTGADFTASAGVVSLNSATVARLSSSNTWGDGVKQTLNPNGTNAGLNVGSHTADPSSLANGDLWYNSTTNLLKAQINNVTTVLGAGGGAPTTAPYWTSSADGTLSAETNLALIPDGLLKHTVAGSVSTPARALPETDYMTPTGVGSVSGKRIEPRYQQLSAATGTPTAIDVGATGADIYHRLDIGTGTYILACPTGVPVNGQRVEFWLRPAGAAPTLQFTTGAGCFSPDAGLLLPTTTGDASTIVMYAFKYNSVANRFLYAGGTKATAPVAQPAPIRPYSAIPVTAGLVYGCVIDGDEMLCAADATTINADAIWRLGFQMPPVLDTGCTYKLQLDMKANAATGVMRINPKWNTWAPGVTRASLTLNPETVTPDSVTGAAGAGDTVTLGAGDTNQLIRITWILNASTVTAGQRIAMDLTFENASTTLAVQSGYLPSIICE